MMNERKARQRVARRPKTAHPRPVLRFTVAVVAALVGAGAANPAIAQPTVSLQQAIAAPSEEFSGVAGVVELADGRWLVADAAERRLVVLDPRSGQVASLGRVGSGPREFRSIGEALLVRPGGGAFVVDFAQRRLLPVDEGGRLHDAVPLPSPTIQYLVADDSGRLWGEAMVFTTDRRLSDTVRIVRWDVAGGRVETLLSIDAGRSAMVARRGEPRRVWAPTASWTMLPGSDLVVVESEPYRFRRWRGGRWLSERIIPSPAIPVTEADREAWIAEQESAPVRLIGPGRSGVGNGPPPGWRDGGLVFPRTYPAFDAGTPLRVAPDGRLWIERAHPAADPYPRYDVLSDLGLLVAHVVLPMRARVVGFGADVVVLAERDRNDVERLRAYSLPRLGG